MLSAEIIVAPTSLNDVRTAVETRLPNAEWIRLEGSSSGPVKSLSHLLKIECSELEKLLGKPKSQKNGLKDRLGSPNVALFRPDRGEKFGTGTYFSLGARPSMRLSDALSVLGSESTTRNEYAANPLGSNQCGSKRRGSLSDFPHTDHPDFVSDSGGSQKRARAEPTQFQAIRSPSRPSTHKEFADAGRRAAEWINSVPKGEARATALRHMYSNLSKTDKRSFRAGLCTVSEVEQVKLVMESEMAEYRATLREIHDERQKRRIDEMPEMGKKYFTGIRVFAKKSGSLDTRPETERDAEFESTCKVTYEILKMLLMSQTRKEDLDRAKTQATLKNGSITLTTTEKGLKVKQAYSGEELKEVICTYEQSVSSPLSLIRDVLVLSSSNLVPEGSVERALFVKSFGGTHTDQDVKSRERQGIHRNSLHELETTLALHFEKNYEEEVRAGVRKTKSLVELDDNHNPYKKYKDLSQVAKDTKSGGRSLSSIAKLSIFLDEPSLPHSANALNLSLSRKSAYIPFTIESAMTLKAFFRTHREALCESYSSSSPLPYIQPADFGRDIHPPARLRHFTVWPTRLGNSGDRAYWFYEHFYRFNRGGVGSIVLKENCERVQPSDTQFAEHAFVFGNSSPWILGEMENVIQALPPFHIEGHAKTSIWCNPEHMVDFWGPLCIHGLPYHVEKHKKLLASLEHTASQRHTDAKAISSFITSDGEPTQSEINAVERCLAEGAEEAHEEVNELFSIGSEGTEVSENMNPKDEDEDAAAVNEGAQELKQRFCSCQDGSKVGRMIACDGRGGEQCEHWGGWFHFDCVGLETEPAGSWSCPDCQALQEAYEKGAASTLEAGPHRVVKKNKPPCKCKKGCRRSCPCAAHGKVKGKSNFGFGEHCSNDCECTGCENPKGRGGKPPFSNEVHQSTSSRKATKTNYTHIDRKIRYVNLRWPYVRERVLALLLEKSGKPQLCDALDFFRHQGPDGAKVVRLWTLLDHTIPLVQEPFAEWDLEGNAFHLFNALPRLILLYLANDMPNVARVTLVFLHLTLHWKESRPDILRTIGGHCKRLQDKFIEFHNMRNMGWLNEKGDLTIDVFKRITCLVKVRAEVKQKILSECSFDRKEQKSEIVDLMERYTRPSWEDTHKHYDSWLFGVFKSLCDRVKVWRRDSDDGFVAAKSNDPMWVCAMEKIDGAIDGVQKTAEKALKLGSWHMADSAAAVKAAAAELGVDVSKCKNRDEYSEVLVNAGWTYFDYFIRKQEEKCGRRERGGRIELEESRSQCRGSLES